MISNGFMLQFFKQGLVKRGGNCASIALIKSAMGIYGLKVFDCTDKGGYFDVVLKNGEQVELHKEELAFANRLHGFEQQIFTEEGNTYFEYAKLSFAVMAKVCMLDRRLKSYKSAVTDLNRGENADYITQFLRLDDFYTPVLERGDEITEAEFDETVNTLSNLILYSEDHVVLSSAGKFDDHGEIIPITEEEYGFIYLRKPIY